MNTASNLKVEYRTAKETVMLNWFGALGSMGLLLFVLWARWNVPPKNGGEQAAFYLMMLFASSSSIFFIVMLRYQCSYIVLLDNGIQQYLPNGSSHFLAWTDIKDTIDNRIRGQLELIPLNQDNQRPVAVSYNLAGFAHLKCIIYEKTNIKDKDLLFTTFHRGKITRVVFIFSGTVFLVPGVFFLYSGRVIPAIIAFLFTYGALLAYRSEFTSITFYAGYLSINYPKRSLTIPFDSIKEFSMLSGSEILIIELYNKKQLKVGGFQEGSFAFYRKLKASLAQLAQHKTDFNQNTCEGR